jgi:hypothetical protein
MHGHLGTIVASHTFTDISMKYHSKMGVGLVVGDIYFFKKARVCEVFKKKK